MTDGELYRSFVFLTMTKASGSSVKPNSQELEASC